MSTNQFCDICGKKAFKSKWCNDCYNRSLVEVFCNYCRKPVRILDKYINNSYMFICTECNEKHQCEVKCVQCGLVEKTLHTNGFHKDDYRCTVCCPKVKSDCIICRKVFECGRAGLRQPICMECRYQRFYVQGKCTKCCCVRFFHYKKNPRTTVCQNCHFSKPHRH